MDLWDLADSYGVSRHYMFLAWVRGCPIVDFYITQAAWNTWIAANPF